jgi:bla regulator protein blaR1
MLANELSLQLGRTVIDKTNLKGEYDFTLEWMPEPGQGGPEAFGFPPGPETPPPSETEGPSIFTAIQEQLGLRLDSERGPAEIMVMIVRAKRQRIRASFEASRSTPPPPIKLTVAWSS